MDRAYDALAKYSRRHMFRMLRTHARFYLSGVLIAIGIADFIRIPDTAIYWFAARLAYVSYVWIAFAIVARYSCIRKRIDLVVYSIMFFISVFANVKVVTTGGVHSAYTVSIIVASSGLMMVFRLGKIGSALVQMMFIVPAIFCLFYFSSSAEYADAAVISVFYIGMLVASVTGAMSSDDLNHMFNRAYRTALHEVEKLRRTDILKSHFPQAIRAEIEAGKFTIENRIVSENAVVGFADIICSTKIGNSVDLETDWQLKEAFISAATQRATEFGMVVLNQMGDGFFFLANYGELPNWQQNLLSFYESLTLDLERILTEMKKEIIRPESGIRFGIARGPVMIGWLGSSGQTYFTAMGPEVNLAARLCAAAEPNEMVVSSLAGYAMEDVLRDKVTERRFHTNLKGFEIGIPALHIKHSTLIAA